MTRDEDLRGRDTTDRTGLLQRRCEHRGFDIAAVEHLGHCGHIGHFGHSGHIGHGLRRERRLEVVATRS